jgi:hypothetical protein
MLPSHRILRIGLAVLMIATLIRVWAAPGLLQRAEAQIPDAGLQRLKILEENRRSNELLLEIRQLLAEGTLNVRLQGADNQAGYKPTPPGGP